MSRVPVSEWWIRRMCRWIDLTRKQNTYGLPATVPFSTSFIEARMRELKNRVPGKLCLNAKRYLKTPHEQATAKNPHQS